MFGRKEQTEEQVFRDRRKITELREDVMVLIGLLPPELYDHDLVKDIDARMQRDTGGSPIRFYRNKFAKDET